MYVQRETDPLLRTESIETGVAAHHLPPLGGDADLGHCHGWCGLVLLLLDGGSGMVTQLHTDNIEIGHHVETDAFGRYG